MLLYKSNENLLMGHCGTCNRYELIGGVCIGCGNNPTESPGCDCPKKKPGNDDRGPMAAR